MDNRRFVAHAHINFGIGAAEAPPHDAQPQQQAHVDPAGIFARQNWGLLVKMLVLVYILAQGGSTTRLIVLSIGAIALYLYMPPPKKNCDVS